MSNKTDPSAKSFTPMLRRVVCMTALVLAGMGIWTVWTYSEQPRWEHGMTGFSVIGFFMLALALMLGLCGPRLLSYLARLEARQQRTVGASRYDSWVLHGFCFILLVAAACLFGWMRGFCEKAVGVDAEEGVLEMHARAQPQQPRRGFTLLELLIAISIVIVLSSLLAMAALNIRENARRSVAFTTVRGLYVAMDAYELENGAWPTRVDANDIYVNYDSNANPRRKSDKLLNILYTYYKFNRDDIDSSAEQKLIDPWGNPYVYQILDATSTDADEQAAGLWWAGQNLDHPAKIYSVGSPGNFSETPTTYATGHGYWVAFKPVGELGVIYVDETQEMGQ